MQCVARIKDEKSKELKDNNTSKIESSRHMKLDARCIDNTNYYSKKISIV